MTQKKQPYLPIKRMSKDEITDLAAREIIRDEKLARDEKTKQLKAARLSRDADQRKQIRTEVAVAVSRDTRLANRPARGTTPDKSRRMSTF